MKLHLRKGGRSECIAERVECATTPFLRFRGLMLRASIPEDYALLIPLPPKKMNIHTLFMRFPIDLLLMDEHMRVMGIHTLKPWRSVVFFEGMSWAVEMRAGRTSQYSIALGDVLELVK
ncbi:MAG: DUF192 domain-containing protein [Methermicoccaceae archaeon]